MSSKAIFLVLCASVLLSTGTTHAALFDRGNGLIFDDVLNITWLQDANYAKTSGVSAEGQLTWSDALNWAANLQFAGYSDWRLPKTPIIDSTCAVQAGTHSYSSNCIGNEMGHLFYVDLGGTAGSPISTSVDPDLALFSNIREEMSSNYWFGSPWYEESTRAGFDFFDGTLNYGNPDASLYVWAVRDGDVTSVPEPASLSLTIAGLAILGVLLKKSSPES